LAEGKNLLGELARLFLQTQMEEFATCARVCRDCMKLRRRRDNPTCKIQRLFGTITVDAPRISVCPCRNSWGFLQNKNRPSSRGGWPPTPKVEAADALKDRLLRLKAKLQRTYAGYTLDFIKVNRANLS
jgi:hypothetical protein